MTKRTGIVIRLEPDGGWYSQEPNYMFKAAPIEAAFHFPSAKEARKQLNVIRDRLKCFPQAAVVRLLPPCGGCRHARQGACARGASPMIAEAMLCCAKLDLPFLDEAGYEGAAAEGMKFKFEPL